MKKITTEIFKEKLKNVFNFLKNEDLKKVNYINTETEVEIYCSKHEIYFKQRPSTLTIGKWACPCCIHEKNIRLKQNKEKVFEQAAKIHNNKYIYFPEDYKGKKIKTKIYCPKHKFIFYQTMQCHINRKQKCPKCALEDRIKKRRLSNEQALNLLKNDKYDYSLMEYKGYDHSIKIICKKCGNIFEQIFYNHLTGDGCPNCNNYKGEEKIIDYLNKNNIKFEHPKKYVDLKDVNLLSYDFYLPDYNLLIEYNGRQHYKFVEYFQKNLHNFHRQLHHDWLKRKYAIKNDINLLVIPYWENLNEILYSIFI